MTDLYWIDRLIEYACVWIINILYISSLTLTFPDELHKDRISFPGLFAFGIVFQGVVILDGNFL